MSQKYEIATHHTRFSSSMNLVFGFGGLQTPLGSLRRFLRPPSRLGRGIPLTHFATSGHLQRLDLDAFGASILGPLIDSTAAPTKLFYAEPG